MALVDVLEKDLVSALKSGKDLELRVLRGTTAALKNLAIEKRTRGENDVVTDEDVLAILNKEMKKRKEAIVLYNRGERPELARAEQDEMVVLERYLPAQLGRAEIEQKIDSVLERMDDRSFGVIMKESMKELQGIADGKIVADIIKEKLNV